MLTGGDDRANCGEGCNIDVQIRVQQQQEMVWPPLPWYFV